MTRRQFAYGIVRYDSNGDPALVTRNGITRSVHQNPGLVPPGWDTLDFLHWKNDLLCYKAAQSLWIPDITYYVSPTGNDSNDGLTAGNAFATTDKVQAVIDAVSGDKLEFLFERDGVWDTFTHNTTVTTVGTAVLKVNKDYIRLGAYGTGAKPYFENFTTKLTSGWSFISGTSYSCTPGVDVACVRLASAPTVPLHKAGTSDVSASKTETSGNWYFDNGTGTLYINLNGTDPNTVTIEVAVSSYRNFIEFSGNGGYAENLAGDGWGMDRVDENTQCHFIRISGVSGTHNTAVACDTLYASSHALAQHRPSGTAGVAVFADCFAGLCNSNSQNVTVYNAFSQTGGHEAYFDNNTAWGMLPSSDWFDVNSRKIHGAAAYGHSGAGNFCAFIMFNKMQSPNVAFGAAVPAYAPGPAVTVESDARVFAFEDYHYNTRAGSRLGYLHAGAGPRVNSSITGVAYNYNILALTNFDHFNAVLGSINCVFDFNFDIYSVTIAWLNGSASQSGFTKHCKFITRVNTNNQLIRIFEYNNGSTFVCNNTVFELIQTGTGATNGFNAPITGSTNAFRGTTNTIGTSPYSAAGTLVAENPTELWGQGTDVSLEYMRNGRKRRASPPAIGDMDEELARLYTRIQP